MALVTVSGSGRSKNVATKKKKKADTFGDVSDGVRGILTNSRKVVMTLGLGIAATGVAVAVMDPRRNTESGKLDYDFKLPLAAGILAWAPVEFVFHNMLGIKKIPKDVARSAAVVAGMLAGSYTSILLPLIQRDPENIVSKVFKFGYDLFSNEDKNRMQQQLAAQGGVTSVSAGKGVFGSGSGNQGGGGFIDVNPVQSPPQQTIGVLPAPAQSPAPQPQQGGGFDIGGLFSGLGNLATGIGNAVGSFNSDSPAEPAMEDEF
ncbi:hypothetical protein OAU50_04395 [Planctomycetota bacterium]|nr:hypothetical protein [Planctomycetota bacterium]